MPIKPENRARYPKHWPQIRARILTRDANRCKECGLQNHIWGFRDAAGDFHRVSKSAIRDTWSRDERRSKKPPFQISVKEYGPVKIIEIVLTIAHLDHVPEHCEDTNLAAMCQRCHLRYDQAHHAVNAAATRREGKALGDLFS